LQVFIAAQCPRCPAVVETALFAWRRFAPEPFLIVDAEQFPDLTLRYGIKAVPAIVLDRRLVLTGAIAPGRLTELIALRGTASFEAEATRSMLATGGRPFSDSCRSPICLPAWVLWWSWKGL
ncbi:MAG: hypothetical protein H6Q05_4287, partial [Acidobacteria bacterium]|nr:hypothetical protein [Acidobacteriota bacterium]